MLQNNTNETIQSRSMMNFSLEILDAIFNNLDNKSTLNWLCLNKKLYEQYIPYVYNELKLNERINLKDVYFIKYGKYINTINIEGDDPSKFALFFELKKHYPGVNFKVKCSLEVAKTFDMLFRSVQRDPTIFHFYIMNIQYTYIANNAFDVGSPLVTDIKEVFTVEHVEKVEFRIVGNDVHQNFLDPFFHAKIQHFCLDAIKVNFQSPLAHDLNKFELLITLELNLRDTKFEIDKFCNVLHSNLKKMKIVDRFNSIPPDSELIITKEKFPKVEDIMLLANCTIRFIDPILSLKYLCHASFNDPSFPRLNMSKYPNLINLQISVGSMHHFRPHINIEDHLTMCNNLAKIAFYNLVITTPFLSYLNNTCINLNVLYLDNCEFGNLSPFEQLPNLIFDNLTVLIVSKVNTALIQFIVNCSPNLNVIYFKYCQLDHDTLRKIKPRLKLADKIYHPDLVKFTSTFSRFNFI